MELGCFGQDQSCTPGMETDSSALSSSLRTGPTRNSMENSSLGEDSFQRLCQQSEKIVQSIQNGKMLGTLFLIVLDTKSHSKTESKHYKKSSDHWIINTSNAMRIDNAKDSMIYLMSWTE